MTFQNLMVSRTPSSWPECVFLPPNPYVEVLTPNMAVFEPGAYKVKRSHKGGVLNNVLRRKDTRGAPGLLSKACTS